MLMQLLNLHAAVRVGFGNAERGLHDLVETVIRHVPGDEQLRSGNVVQLTGKAIFLFNLNVGLEQQTQYSPRGIECGTRELPFRGGRPSTRCTRSRRSWSTATTRLRD